MATTEPRTPPLPLEITENIIQLYLGGPYTFPDSHFPSDLVPLLLVCKGWHEYGERQLYRSIYITTDSKDSEAVGVGRLLATLSQNSRLAELVHFFTFESKYFADNTVHAITRIISLSSNLTHLSISRLDGHWRWQGIDTPVVESLRHALAERSLKDFRLYTGDSRKWMFQTDTLCSLIETLALLANWPNLEEISLIDESAYENRFDFPPEIPARCLALRRIEVQGFDIACFFAKIAPFVEDVDIVHDKPVDMGALACLHTWSETLTDLKLYVYDEEAIQDFPPLRKLRYFYCEVTDMHPRCLEPMDSLEELLYCVRPQRAEQLVNCFRVGTGSGDFLPALKVLHFRSAVVLPDPDREFPQGGYDEDELNWVESSRAALKSLEAALKSLEEICARRNISFSADDHQEQYYCS